MRSPLSVITLSIVVTAALWGRPAAAFDSGSDGSYRSGISADGSINLPPNGGNVIVDLPADGKLKCTTITIGPGSTLLFRRNALNTPVYLLATGDINVQGNIDVSGGSAGGSPAGPGPGGPGGFDGGSGGLNGAPPGAGLGPGAGRGGIDSNSPSDAATAAGAGAYGTAPPLQLTSDGKAYGSPLLIPLAGGSGGGGTQGNPGAPGGGGGGAILLASNTRVILNGTIFAVGGAGLGSHNGGSGGAIRIVAPAVVSGTGSLRVSGRQGAGFGRIRVDTLDRTQMQINGDSNGTTLVGTLLIVAPRIQPRLDIVQAADQDIPVGTQDPVLVELPAGSSTTRTIVVQATDFQGIVLINVVLTPESGPPTVVPAQIDMSTGNPARVAVSVTVPVNVHTRINVYTR